MENQGGRAGAVYAPIVIRSTCHTRSRKSVLSSSNQHPAKCRTLRLTAFDPSRRTWASPLVVSVTGQLKSGGEELLHRLDRRFVRGFVISDVRPAFDTRVIETVGLVGSVVEEDPVF